MFGGRGIGFAVGGGVISYSLVLGIGIISMGECPGGEGNFQRGKMIGSATNL